MCQAWGVGALTFLIAPRLLPKLAAGQFVSTLLPPSTLPFLSHWSVTFLSLCWLSTNPVGPSKNGTAQRAWVKDLEVFHDSGERTALSLSGRSRGTLWDGKEKRGLAPAACNLVTSYFLLFEHHLLLQQLSPGCSVPNTAASPPPSPQ